MDDSKTALSNAFWSLCHGPDQVRIDGLQLVQVQALIKAFAPAAIDSWFVWFEGENDWIPLAERLPLITGPELDALTPTPMPMPMPEANPAPKQQQETVTASLNPAADSATRTPPRNTRQMPRFQMRIEAIIEFKGKLLKSHTVDVSLAGMRVEDAMPFPADSIVMVTLRHKGAELGMRCRVVESSDKPQHHRLLIHNCNRMEVLRSWIVGAPA